MLSVRAPDHFGDGVMAIPAIAAMGAARGARVHAPRWGTSLYCGLPGVEVVSRDESPLPGSTGVLLKPSFGAAWRWRGLPQRVGLDTFSRGCLLTEALQVRPGEHRRDGWMRVACGALGEDERFAPMPTYLPRVSGPTGDGRVAVNVWGATARTRWPEMLSCARTLAERVAVVLLAGPGEGDAVRSLAGGLPVHEHEHLPAFATWISTARCVLSHDSGVAHFAAACGARVVMVHGPTRPWETGVGEAVCGDRGRWPAVDVVLARVLEGTCT